MTPLLLQEFDRGESNLPFVAAIGDLASILTIARRHARTDAGVRSKADAGSGECFTPSD